VHEARKRFLRQTPELIPWRRKAGFRSKQVLTSTVTLWFKRETGLLFFLRLAPLLAFHAVEKKFPANPDSLSKSGQHFG
jgi:hypothetical protein